MALSGIKKYGPYLSKKINKYEKKLNNAIGLIQKGAAYNCPQKIQRLKEQCKMLNILRIKRVLTASALAKKLGCSLPIAANYLREAEKECSKPDYDTRPRFNPPEEISDLF